MPVMDFAHWLIKILYLLVFAAFPSDRAPVNSQKAKPAAHFNQLEGRWSLVANGCIGAPLEPTDNMGHDEWDFKSGTFVYKDVRDRDAEVLNCRSTMTGNFQYLQGSREQFELNFGELKTKDCIVVKRSKTSDPKVDRVQRLPQIPRAATVQNRKWRWSKYLDRLAIEEEFDAPPWKKCKRFRQVYVQDVSS